jgi:hypothetical protein
MANSRHGRLHKRGNSASSMTSQLSPVADQGAFTFNRSETPMVTYEEPWNEIPTKPMPTASSSHPLKIKPYIRKLSSSKDSNALDLSRPVEENERLAGLGISEYGGYSPSVSDVNFAPVNGGRNRHTRSTSNTSQFSTSSSLQRPTAPYVPSVRPIPRPYTPPISNSTPASVLGSEAGVEDITIMTDEEYRSRQHAFDPARRSGSISSSTPGAPPTLRIHTTSSSTRLAGSYSQSSVSLTSPIAQSRPRGDTLKSMEATTSPISRTSLDKAFGFVRPSRDAPTDPVSRAANIRAAREAFIAKEEAQAERDLRKQQKKAEHQRRKSDPPNDKHAHAVPDSNHEKTPRPSIGGTQYSVRILPCKLRVT